MSKNKDYDYGRSIRVRKEINEKLESLMVRYERMKSPFLELKKVDFVDIVLDLGFEELNVTKEDFEEAFKKEKERG